jgi:hypothetical protein
MECLPLTPPQDAPIMTDKVEAEDEDVHMLKRWLRSRGINIAALIKEHNRVTIPVEEDITVLLRLKEILQGLPNSAPIGQAVALFFAQLSERVQTLEAEATAAGFNYYMSFPDEQLQGVHSFLRSRSVISTHILASTIIPSLLERVDAAEAQTRHRGQDSLAQTSKHQAMPQGDNRFKILKRTPQKRQTEVKSGRRSRTGSTIRSPKKQQVVDMSSLRRSSRLRQKQHLEQGEKK